jgi:hypothetical protein
MNKLRELWEKVPTKGQTAILMTFSAISGAALLIFVATGFAFYFLLFLGWVS